MASRAPSLFRYSLLCLLMIPAGACVDAFASDDIDSWNPPPKKCIVSSLRYIPGLPPRGLDMPNLCNKYYLRLSRNERVVNLRPMTSLTPAGEERLKEVLAVPEEEKRTFDFPTIAAMDGYGANYLDLKRGDIIPLLGHLFYLEGEAELRRLEPTHAAYKQLGFPVEGTFSFPYPGEISQKWYEAVYDRVRNKEERNRAVQSGSYPNYAYSTFRGHKIIVRNIRKQSDDATSPLEAEIAVVPLVLRWRVVGFWPTEDDFHRYSVGDELRIPWALLARGGGVYSAGKAVESTITDPRYYKITNIVLPDFPTIQVQPEDGGAPIECKPIGWVDIDIHGREEPAGKKE